MNNNQAALEKLEKRGMWGMMRGYNPLLWMDRE